MIPFPNKKYKVIYADPPWQFNNKNTGGSLSSGAANHYDVMTHEDICQLPVQDIADDDCILFMWWVASQPEEALRVVKSWGFTLKTMTGFVWDKETKHGKDFFGMGFYTRQGSENCLIAVKGKPQKVSSSVRAVTRAKVGKHSEKPNVFNDKIVELMGDVPRIELFARNTVDGWDSWGKGLSG
jgi:N6-adenosine-specific RNA methylase IME4